MNISYRYGVILFNEKYLNELKRIYEITILKNLRLDKNFIQKILCI